MYVTEGSIRDLLGELIFMVKMKELISTSIDSKSYTPGLVTAHALLKMDSRALEHLQFMQKSLLHIFH